MKHCSSCKQEKPKTSFWKNKRMLDGLDRYCSDCGKTNHKKDYELHKDKHLLRMKEYQQRPEFKEQHKQYQETWMGKGGDKWFKEYHKDYADKHPGRREKISQAWYEQHPERRTEIKKKYMESNYGKVLAWNAKRRAQRNQAVPGWFEKEQVEVLYNQSTQKTVNEGIIYHVDHIIPINSKDVCGLHCLANLQILTAKENLAKSNKLIEFKGE